MQEHLCCKYKHVLGFQDGLTPADIILHRRRAEGVYVWETARTREGQPIIEALLKAKHYGVLHSMLASFHERRELLADAIRIAKRSARA